MNARREERLVYAFGHLVAGHARPDDAHSTDSLDHGFEVLESLGCADTEAIGILAEHVAANYEYTGKGEEILRKIKAEEL